jgi:hypothetical protein
LAFANACRKNRKSEIKEFLVAPATAAAPSPSITHCLYCTAVTSPGQNGFDTFIP